MVEDLTLKLCSWQGCPACIARQVDWLRLSVSCALKSDRVCTYDKYKVYIKEGSLVTSKGGAYYIRAKGFPHSHIKGATLGTLIARNSFVEENGEKEQK